MIDDSKLILLVPDTHHDYHDQRAVNNVIRMLAAVKFDEVCLLGDFIDCKAPARWSRGMADEYAADLNREATAARKTLDAMRQVHDGSVTWLTGNHEARIANYVASHAPALAGVVRGYAELMDFEGFKIIEKAQPYRIAPGVAAIHGEKLSSTQSAAGQSAFKERVRHGASIVQGHSHRLGLGWDTADRTRFWMEAGWLGDIRKAAYLPFKGVANWQQGFGWLRVEGNRVTPGVVPIHGDGSFYFDGKRYG